MSWDIFPSWMGIHGFGDLILAIFCCIIILFLYFLFGGLFCPSSIKNHCVRMLCVAFWPLMPVLFLLFLPFGALYEFSKTPEEQDKAYKDFIRENQ